MFRKEFFIEISITAVKAFIAIVLAIILTGYFKSKIVNISNSLKSQKLAAFALQKRSQTIRQLQNDFKQIGPAESFLQAATPYADNVVDLKAAVEGVAHRQALQSVVDFSLPKPDQLSIDYSISVGAGINSLITYLGNFEKLPFLTNINSIEIRSDQNSTWEGAARVNMRAVVYTKPVE